jgi:hypothetical protein
VKKAVIRQQRYVGHPDGTLEMDIIRKRPGILNRDVLIVIRSSGRPHRDALVSFVDLWLARELAQQIAKDIMTPKAMRRTRARSKPKFSSRM